jgi:hypothetical protein
VSQSVDREEDASERDAREKTHLKLWREKGWGGVVPQKKGEGGNCWVAGERLREFPRDRNTSQPWEFTQTVPHIHVTHFTPLHQVHFCPPSSDAGAFFLSFSLTVPPLYRYRGPPLSLANREGVVPFFFHDVAPFRS